MTHRERVAETWARAFREGEPYRLAFDRRAFDRAHGRSSVACLLRRSLPSSARVLEPGCGSGIHGLVLAAGGRRVVALDYADGALAAAGTHAGLVRAWYPRIRHDRVRGDAECLPFAEGVFDAVFNEGVVEHWLELEARLGVLREMVRVTRVGGRVIVVVPNGTHPFWARWERDRYPGHFGPTVPPLTRYDIDRLARELGEVGLEVVERGGLNPFGSLNVWPRRPGLGRVLGLLDRFAPRPRRFSERWGFNLYVVGERHR